MKTNDPSLKPVVNTSIHIFHRDLVPWWLVGADADDWGLANIETDIPLKTSTGKTVDAWQPHSQLSNLLSSQESRQVKRQTTTADVCSESSDDQRGFDGVCRYEEISEKLFKYSLSRLNETESRIRNMVLWLCDSEEDKSPVVAGIRDAIKDAVEKWLGEKYNSVLVWRTHDVWVRYISRKAAGQIMKEISL